jgi:hypothetical protein
MKDNPELHSELDSFPKRLDISQVSMYGLSFLSAGMFLFLPFFNLLHTNPWKRWIGTIHSFTALLATVLVVYMGHLAFPVLRGNSKALPSIRTLTFWSTLSLLSAIISGHFVYIRYRSNDSLGGTHSWLINHSPLTHYLLTNYHIFTVLFTIPLGVACVWILWRYGDSILEKRFLPILSTTCITLMTIMFFTMGGLITGLGIAKLHG